jgi:hypothetical protein
MSSEISVIGAIVGHFFADFALQFDWLAKNKKSDNLACLIHCLIWVGCVALFSGWGFFPLAFVFICHYAQDRTQFISWYMDQVCPGFKVIPFSFVFVIKIPPEIDIYGISLNPIS